MFAHFKWTARRQTLHLMEFAAVNFFGIFLMQMMQKSSSSEEDDDDLSFAGDFCCLVFLARLAGGDAIAFFFGVAFFASAAAFFASAAFFFSLRTAMLSGDVKMALCIGFRPRFLPVLAAAGFNGPISLKTEAKLDERESCDIDVGA